MTRIFACFHLAHLNPAQKYARFFKEITTHTDPNPTGIYNASKAALHMLDSTLRLELAPLHISVLTVVTGAIETSFMSNIQEPQFLPNSYYLAIQDKAKVLARGEDGHPRTNSAVYAEKVVKDVLSGKTGKVWHGKNAAMTRAANVALPVWIMVSYSLVSCCYWLNFANCLDQDRMLSDNTGMNEV